MYFFCFLFAFTFITEASTYIVIITNLKDLRRFASNVREDRPHPAIVPEVYYDGDERDETETTEYIDNETNDRADFRARDSLDNAQVDILVKKIKQKLIEELNLKPIGRQGVFKIENEPGIKQKQEDETPENHIKPGFNQPIRVQKSNQHDAPERPKLNSIAYKNYNQDAFKKREKINIANYYEETGDSQLNNAKNQLPVPVNHLIKSKNNKIMPKGVIGSPSPIRNTKKRVLTQTTEENPIFEGVEMKYKNDSYEDYVIPEKDENYDDSPAKNIRNTRIKPAISNKVKFDNQEKDENDDEIRAKNIRNKLINPAIPNKVEFDVPENDENDDEIRAKNIRNKLKNQSFSNNVKFSPHKQVNADYDEVTTYYPEPYRPENQLKNPKYNKESNQNDKNIFDYEEKMAVEELYTVVTKHVEKARTESLIYEDNNDRQNYNQNRPKNDQNRENTEDSANNDVETTKANKGMNTMIPTRERYTISTPNYYEQLPRIAEKYDFQEPIPEQDRLPDVVKQIGPKPEIINGNVRV